MIILGTNSIKDTGYDVANSLRFNPGSSDYLNRTLSAGNNQTWTFSAWIKKNSSGSNYPRILGLYIDANDYLRLNFNREADGEQLHLYYEVSGTASTLLTNRLFRDFSAWYHIVVSVNTTLGTADDRLKIYVNGVQETSFATRTNPSQNSTTPLNNNGDVLLIGKKEGGSSDYYNGYMAEVCLIDGQALDPTSFGEFDEDSGIWKPIDVSGLTFGTNGFYLDFEDSSALGNDVSGNDNDFTVNNLTAIDQSTDTCTNNFSTMNFLDNYYTAATFSDGNLKIVTQNGGNYAPRVSNFAVSQGKWYAEVKYISRSSGDNFSLIGIKSTQTTNTNYLGQNDDDYGFYSENGKYYEGGSATSYGTSYDQGDIIGIYLDLDNNKLYFAKNGTIMNSGTGISITDPASTDQGYYFISAGDYGNSVQITYEWNFGSPTFSISSGNTDANGYGNFEYDPSSGTFDGASKDFFALNTKNLAEYG